MLMFNVSPEELARALDKATEDLEHMGDDITDVGDVPLSDDEDEDEAVELVRSDSIEAELGGAFDGMSEEYKAELREKLELVHESISKVHTCCLQFGVC